jgi:hypothetical protein
MHGRVEIPTAFQFGVGILNGEKWTWLLKVLRQDWMRPRCSKGHATTVAGNSAKLLGKIGTNGSFLVHSVRHFSLDNFGAL